MGLTNSQSIRPLPSDQKSTLFVSGKLLIQEAWDEPTSENSSGKHGPMSVFNEGRATVLSVTKPIVGGAAIADIKVETDLNILNRFGELAVCADFQRVAQDESNHVLEVCVAKKNGTKKLALMTHNRKPGEVHHPSVKPKLLKVSTYGSICTCMI